MAFQMVDGNKRQIIGEGYGLRGREADHHAADQARSGRRRHEVEIGESMARFFNGLRYDDVHSFDMTARGDLRHDPAIDFVIVEIRPDAV